MIQEVGIAPLIVLEGIDGSGKGTQAALLQQRLTALGKRTEILSFPRYQQTFFGARIGEFLNGEFGTLAQLDPFLVSLLYAGDRFESRDELQRKQQANDVIVLDRYVSSNIGHQSAKREGDARRTLRTWIEHIEFEIFKLPRPELTILLDIPTEVSQQLIRLKEKRSYTDQTTDLQESDVEYMSRVREIYLELAASTPGWVIVPVTRQGELRPVEEIAEEILALVQSKL